MDIVVTVPKSELKNVSREQKWAAEVGAKKTVCFWKVGREPKKLKPGDRVYFVHDGMIVNYNEFIGCDWDCHCEVTHRDWPGLNLVMKNPETWLKHPVPMKGFQGFRYLKERPNEN